MENVKKMRFLTYMEKFQTLYESSIAFGIRKALQAEQGKTDMENYIAKLEEGKTGLEKEVRQGRRSIEF